MPIATSFANLLQRHYYEPQPNVWVGLQRQTELDDSECHVSRQRSMDHTIRVKILIVSRILISSIIDEMLGT